LASSSAADLWDGIAAAAADESPLWEDSLLPPAERRIEAVFSPLGEARFALGLETIYEGYLAHYGRPRLFEPADADVALLLGDYLYAQGLVRIAELGDVDAVGDLAELISLCAQLQAEGAAGDGLVWAATSASLGRGVLDEARAALRDHGDPAALEAAARQGTGADELARALAAHSRLLG
jgi:hypothetical protein